MLDSHTVAFITIAAILTMTPGADTLLVVRNVLARGQRAGLVTMLGICSGLFVHAAFSALGLSLILVQSADLFEAVKLVGAAYLVLLGAQSLWNSQRANDLNPLPQRERGFGSYAEGVLTNVLNPKVAIFYLAFLPQFIEPGDPVFAKSLLLASIHLAMGIVWLSSVTFFIGRMAQVLSHASLRKKMERISGGVMVALGVRLALEKR